MANAVATRSCATISIWRSVSFHSLVIVVVFQTDLHLIRVAPRYRDGHPHEKALERLRFYERFKYQIEPGSQRPIAGQILKDELQIAWARIAFCMMKYLSYVCQ